MSHNTALVKIIAIILTNVDLVYKRIFASLAPDGLITVFG